MIPYSRQSISEGDIAEVARVLRSDFLTQGPEVPRFEEAVQTQCGAPHAVAVASATAALHLACKAMGLGPGGLLWTSPNTFVASANCARYCGADVDFVDIDPGTLNLSVEALERKLTHSTRLPQIVVPVHFAGQSCDMAGLKKLADRFGFRILEDASHALGASYDGRPVGDCRSSDASVFSFHPVKMITSGEGGMVVTRDAGLAARVQSLRSHGITREPSLMSQPPDGPWYYEQVELGYHYRMTDIQAALGRSQLARLDEFVAVRRRLAARYRNLLAGLPVAFQEESPYAESSYHLFVVRVPRRLKVFQALRAQGIGVNVHYIPVHLQPDYRALGFATGLCPAAEAYYAEALSLPVHALLSEKEQEFIVAALEQALK